MGNGDICHQMHDNWKQIINYGPRPFGTENIERCSSYLLKEMEKITPGAFVESYDVPAWHPVSWGLEVKGERPRQIESYPFLGSGASEGFEGTVIFAGYNRIWDMYVWPRYAVVNRDGEIAAYITIRENGDAIPQMLFTGDSELPHFLVGSQEAGYFEELQNQKVIIKGYARIKKIPDAKCRNVVGLLGEQTEKMVLCAHYDTVYNNQGAYDNSSGAAVLLEIGRRIKAEYECTRQIELLLTDGEEYNLVGSRQRYEKCADEEISMVLCIDGIGRDEVLEVWSGPEPLERRIRAILGKSKDEFTPLYTCPPPPGSDHAPYFAAGIPACMLTFNDQEILHSPLDVYEKSRLKNMNIMVRIALELMEELNIIRKKKVFN